MNKCERFCDKDMLPLLKNYTKKYKSNKNQKKLNIFNKPFWKKIMQDACKEDLCNLKCKYTKSRKNVFNKVKGKIPILSYCRKSEAIEKKYVNSL